MLRLWFSIAVFSLLNFNLLADTVNPTIDQLCSMYESKAKTSARGSLDKYSDMIIKSCSEFSVTRLLNKKDRTINLRPIIYGNDDIFRSGQVFQEDNACKELKKLNINYVVNLRYDHLYNASTNSIEPSNNISEFKDAYAGTYGPTEYYVPLGANESKYKYLDEKKYVESCNMKSIYLPTVPEMEQVVAENYIPKFDLDTSSKPYLCRLPVDLYPIKPLPHWLYNTADIPEESRILLSSRQDCRDLYAKWGEKRVREWRKEVLRLTAISDELFLRIAKQTIALSKKGKVLFHCAHGTDRTGRVASYIELQLLGVTPRELLAYKGPTSDPKIDLIAVNYLLSQRKGGFVPDYRNFSRTEMESSLIKDPLYIQLYQREQRTLISQD